MVNSLLTEFNQIPIDATDSFPNDIERNLESLFEKLRNILLPNHPSKNEFQQIIDLVKEKFNTVTNDEKIQLLTILPPSWSSLRIANEMNCNEYLAKRSKERQKDHGIFSYPKIGTIEEMKKLINAFYCQNDVSEKLPGKENFITIEKDGMKCKIQKREILGNLKEIYLLFKEQNMINVDFNKFAELKPENCVLIGCEGIHTPNVCLLHKNIKLMISALKLDDLSESWDNCPKNYSGMLTSLMCDSPKTKCHFGNCRKCLNFSKLENSLNKIFLRNGVQEIILNEWTTTLNNCQLTTISYSPESYIRKLKERLTILMKHDFIAKNQKKFFFITKLNLKKNEFIILVNFSENLNISENQIIHPCVIYHKENGEIKERNFIIISDHTEHDSVTIYHFQKKLIEHLKKEYRTMKKIFYFSDGIVSQYKNKSNFVNLVNHYQDFGIVAEWHFFATSHGKNPCEKIGGYLRRFALQANELCSFEEINEWAMNSGLGISLIFCSSEMIREERKMLLERFQKTKPMNGMGNYHAFIPVMNKLKVRIFSLAPSSEIIDVVDFNR